MTQKDFTTRKAIVQKELTEVLEDCTRLTAKCYEALAALQEVTTPEQALAFDERFEGLEDNLQHIRLF